MIAKRAHRLRGGAANFELTGLCDVARRIEEGRLRGAQAAAALDAAQATAAAEVRKAAEELSLVLAPAAGAAS